MFVDNNPLRLQLSLCLCLLIVLGACAPSDEDIQKAIEETQTYNQTATALADVEPNEIAKVVPQTVEVTRIVERTVQVTQVVKQTVLVSQGGGEGESATYTGTDYPPLGEEYSAGGYFLIAESVEDPATPDEYSLDKISEGEKLISVLIVIGNRSGIPETIFPGSFNLVDSEGFIYEWECCIRADERDLDRYDDMLVGEKARGWVSFIVPESVVPQYIKYRMSGLDDSWLYAGRYPD